MKRNAIILIFTTLCFFTGVSSKTLLNSGSSITQSSDSLLNSLLNYGMTFMGTPYHYGSSGPRSFDCSGFTSYVYRHFGYNLERDSRHQANQTRYVRKSELQKGDLVFFTSRRSRGSVGHVGIVLEKLENGEFRFIHASTNQGVTISSSDQDYYAARFIKGGRIIDTDIVPLDNSATYAETKNDQTNPNQLTATESTNSDFFSDFHIVKKGESLTEIAEMYDMPITTLKHINGLKNNRIKKGMRLKISDGTNQVLADEQLNSLENVENKITEIDKSLAQEEMVEKSIEKKAVEYNETKHKIRKGETLFSVAKDNNITIQELKKLNHLNSNNLSLGQVLVVNKTAKPEIKEAEVAQSSVNNYPIRQSTTTDLIAQLKQIANNKTVKPSQTEQVKQTSTDKTINPSEQEQTKQIAAVKTIKPSQPEQIEEVVEKVVYTKPLKHKVKKGETISEIADDNNISLSELKKLNHLSSAKIKPGQVLTVKEGKRTLKKEVVKKEIEKQVLAEETKPQVEEIVQEKPVETKTIKPVIEPVKTVTESKLSKHKVARGETLYDIARNNDLTVEELKQMNDLSSDKLGLGQVLTIKKSDKNSKSEQKSEQKTSDKKKKEKQESGLTRHVVKPGETLFSIRRKYGCKLDDLKKWNNLSGAPLQIGQKLVIYQ